MDRGGGLKHVSNRVYMLFLSMETELRKHLTPSCAHETAGVKDVAIAAVKEDEDVLLQWSMFSGNWGEEEAGVLLHHIVDHWIVIIIGFSFTSAFMESYKQETKKSLQKSKGLKLQDNEGD